MGEDRAWMSVREVVELAFADRDVVKNPPTSEEEWGFVADTITDHIVAKFKTQRRLL